ncbi:MAG TPA: ImmA/IrrE family metallo-endopeptidase [Gaiellales bacterium]|nr:ImmA/IrrE family metallo-endopeptidase [Gaiellales bacterium]
MDEVEAARRALRRFSDTYRLTAPPVDVAELAGSLCRLRVRLGDDLRALVNAAPDVHVSGVLLPAAWEIWVRRDESETRRRFTIGHEIGHHFLHSDGATVLCRAADVDQAEEAARLKERQANRFAAELLMPEPLIRERVKRDGLDVTELARTFDVSPIAMAYRLVNLEVLEIVPPDIEAEQLRWRRSV